MKKRERERRIHVPMLRRKFELIPIKIGFFYKFLKLLKIWPETMYYIVQGILSKMAMGEFSIFIVYFNTYTFSDVV